MNNNQQDIKAVAISFFEGCATLDEQARLQQYIEHDPRNMQQFRLWEEEWIKAGAVAVGAGSSLTAGAKTGDYKQITETAKKFVANIKAARAEV